METAAHKTEAFFTQFPQAVYKKGQLLIRAEEDPTCVFYMVEGLVAEYDISPAGNEIVVNVFKPYAFFPMSSAINHTPNHYFFEAIAPTVVHKAPSEQAVKFLQRNPDVAFDLLGRVYRGTDGLLRRMAHLMGGNARSRLLFELLNAAARFGEGSTTSEVFIPLSEGDIAKRSGLSRETINRTIREFKDSGAVTVRQDGIVVASTARLQQLLGIDL
jgi:CRP-like cAMP-binding protein